MPDEKPLAPIEALKVGGQALLLAFEVLLGQAEATLDPIDYARLKAQAERLSRLLAEAYSKPVAVVELVAPL